MVKTTKEEVKKVMDELLTRYSMEEIAVETARGWWTIRRWAKGISIPSKGDWKLLQKMSEK